MIAAELRARVEAALAAMLDDSPSYGAQLRELERSAGLATVLDEEPELGRALMVELRKLRPTTLWVRDRAEPALRAKRLLFLDGAICRCEPFEPLPEPEGRECWLEVSARDAESALDALPRGWGLVVAGPLAGVSFASLRKRAPLRALGALFTGPVLIDASARLDLLVQPAQHGPSASTEPLGARVLTLGESPETHDLTRSALSSGLVCDAETALSWALRLATKRRPSLDL